MDFQTYFGDGAEKMTTCIEGNCNLRGRLHDEFQPAHRAEILLRLHGSFQPGVKFKIAVKSGRPPSCFAENTITEHAQAHFSARAEILMRLHEVFLNFSPS